MLRKEVHLPHPPEDVWTALTTPEAIAEWLMPNDFKPIVGHKFRLQVDGFWRFSGINECEVLEVDPPRRLVFNWVVVPTDPEAKRHEPMVLTWTLEPVEDGTKLVLEQTGLENIHWFYRFSMTMGWGRYMKSLMPKVLANIKDGKFTAGAVPLKKRCYTVKKIPDHLAR
jgi:uncharacterized protein YndB with AHSA1/START domain